MAGASYLRRRGELEVYFDRTAVDAWKRFASDEPLSRIRATVREGRAAMRRALAARLPDDLAGWRVLDAGCGAGHLAVALARRGADVTGIDLSPEMVRFAAETAPAIAGPGRVTFRAGDMLAPEHGRFDAVVAMDSLIHYRAADAVAAVARLAERTERAIVFTVAPATPLLLAMHMAGRLFPRADRAPAIEPVAPRAMVRRLSAEPALGGWQPRPVERVDCGFYISHAMEVARR
ncbi:magnesium protoporphyrin IX methyltransferase [Aquibium sp. A9E412]|uniref:magnesium protoporphyrin IX methyltransferase n=1 Tax=Aquibium sp. A9E412 TaxID=2976767 RepID=UPI0025B1D188|nr:magnesium protoporphyrin IX methyltransferase [Aquibium sp. A9E412]MDN2566061.1 magnesium protoporphyrin IX methyltransferase [Aquibium sp. A9E412]